MNAAHRSFFLSGYLIGAFFVAPLATKSLHAQVTWDTSMGMSGSQDGSSTWIDQRRHADHCG
jgi:hypothetical protein